MNKKDHFSAWFYIFLLILLGAGCTTSSTGKIYHLSALEASELIKKNSGNTQFVILDVRTSNEFKQGHLAGAVKLDYYQPNFRKSLQELDKSKTYLIYCTTGYRSSRTIKMIETMGFSAIYHLQLGIVEWYSQKLPLVRS